MHKQTKFTHTWQIWLAAIVAGVLLPLIASHGTALAAATPQRDGEKEVHGIVQKKPETGVAGPWQVNGETYTATLSTEVNEANGPAAPQSCVKLHVLTDGTNTIRELETQPKEICDGSPGGDDNGGGPGAGDDGPDHDADDDNGVDSTPGNLVPDENEMYSTIITFPVGLVGLWQIGEFTFTTSITTEFDQRNGAFGEGELVKVEYFSNGGATLQATEIKTAITPDVSDDNGDDHGDGSHEGEYHGAHHGADDGQAYGNIEAIDQSGLWRIGGISYTVNISTEIKSNIQDFTVGTHVKVEYRIEGSNLVATEIEITAMGDNPSVADDAKLVGLVNDKPISGTHGVWTVGGVEFEFKATSQLVEEHGDIGKGAYVEIEFVVQNGVRTIVKMESKVPPGAGDDNFTGAIETMDDKGLTAAAVGADSAWVVSGRSFAVTPATQLNGALAPSTTVVVNSFTAADGSQVATRISAVPLTKRIFLPIVVR